MNSRGLRNETHGHGSGPRCIQPEPRMEFSNGQPRIEPLDRGWRSGGGPDVGRMCLAEGALLWLLIPFAKLSGWFGGVGVCGVPRSQIVRRRASIVSATHGAPNTSGLRGARRSKNTAPKPPPAASKPPKKPSIWWRCRRWGDFRDQSIVSSRHLRKDRCYVSRCLQPFIFALIRLRVIPQDVYCPPDLSIPVMNKS